ncbi:transposase [Dokdonella fugitiva]|jgi:transposase|uniref:Transposase n=1 Tax=Dokdonella fugitiva TaxID=328517 RepID=A0A4R2I310_9GAMM|nr:IS66 family transposase [Dokdonella fugitiva]MBA8885607.1 transposase [Dokdonella fugitiva]TCO36825.1 transposase [Dokdonella fugitiva]
MDAAALNAITDVEVLRALVREQIDTIAHHQASLAHHEAMIAQRDALIEQRDRTITYKDAKIAHLTHEIARLRRLQYAAKSERMDPTQRELFDAAMAADIAALEAELEDLRSPTGTREPAQRRAPQRRPLPAELPRIETIHEPASCNCSACGAALVKIGEHVSEKLDVEPLRFFVRREVHPQYACRTCETIVAEPVAPSILDRGLAAPGLLAQVVIQKYADHLPLYRQEAIFARHGIEIGRTTLAEWTGVIGLRLQPLVDALRRKLLQCPVLHADETPVAQLDPGAGKTRRTYLFAYRSTGPRPIVVFDHCPSRAGKHAAAFLGEWNGALMVDDYAGYKALFDQGGITELACWAHARRMFFDAYAASSHPLAQDALHRIAELYAIDAKLRDLDDEARGAERQRYIGPWLAAFKAWLDGAQTLGNSGVRKAIDYALRRWSALARVVEDGAFPIDNNPIENAIRPIAVGRKNWLFAGSETAARRAAAIMSLIATAKANGIEPHAWLTDVLTRLPTTRDRDIESLLPLA